MRLYLPLVSLIGYGAFILCACHTTPTSPPSTGQHSLPPTQGSSSPGSLNDRMNEKRGEIDDVQPAAPSPEKKPISNFSGILTEFLTGFVQQSPLQGCDQVERFLKMQVPLYTISDKQKQELEQARNQACELQRKIQKIETGPQYSFDQLAKLRLAQLYEVADSLKHFGPMGVPSVGEEASLLLLQKIRSSSNQKELLALQKNKKIRAVGSVGVYQTSFQRNHVAQVLQEKILELRSKNGTKRQ